MRAGSGPPSRTASYQPPLEAELLGESFGVTLVPVPPLTDYDAIKAHEDMPAARAPALRAVTKQSLGRLDLDHGPSPMTLRAATERLRSRERSRPLQARHTGIPAEETPRALQGCERIVRPSAASTSV